MAPWHIPSSPFQAHEELEVKVSDLGSEVGAPTGGLKRLEEVGGIFRL